MRTYVLSVDEAKSIRVLAEELQKKYRTVNNTSFHQDDHYHNFKLPISLIAYLANFRGRDTAVFRV